jgi:hypothetical protein
MRLGQVGQLNAVKRSAKIVEGLEKLRSRDIPCSELVRSPEIAL